MNCAPFFIVGSGRSGSTLLRVIMASHSRLAIAPETWFLRGLTSRLPISRPLDSAEVAAAVRMMTTHYRWPDLEIDAGELAEAANRLEQPSLAEVILLVYRRYMLAQGKVRWGDKTPGYITIAATLAKMFPGAQFIHLVRDGRDVAKSFQATGWYGPWLHDNTLEWCEALDYDERWGATPIGGQMLRVRYEDLVRDTERTVRQVCDFLGEAFEPQMLSWEKNITGLVPGREMPIHEKLGRRPALDDIDRWRREMSGREVLVCEAFIGRHLARIGYPRKFAGRSWTPALALLRWYCRHLLPLLGFPVKKLRERRQWRRQPDAA